MTSTSSRPDRTRLSLPLWTERYAAPFAPMTASEMAARGWDAVDVVFVTGDAYVDHPSFAMAILHRSLEQAGFRVAILSQPSWTSCDPWRQFGRPRLFFAVSAGNMDSLINHYTASKKVRNDDAYSPGGRIGLRPDRATLVYSQRCREAFPGVPVVAGGVEASLRRLAHYDYWSDTVKRSILLDSKADLVAYGMGEKTVVEIARRLAAGETVRDLRDMRGLAYALGASESPPPDDAAVVLPTILPQVPPPPESHATPKRGRPWLPEVIVIPSFEEVKADKMAFAEATRFIHSHTNPFNAATLVQYHGRQAIVQNPPVVPLTQAEMDQFYDLPYTRRPHPSYREPVPAHEMIKDSVTIMRGCFGGCTFCSITAHQGRVIQSRSHESVLKEVKKLAADPEFKGVISDIGGATANMYTMRCTKPEIEAKCKRLSCVYPGICKLLGTHHGPLIGLMKDVRETPGIRKVFVASGIRMDLAQLSPEYVKELAAHHVGGRLKVAPEHTSPKVLDLMKKPNVDNFGVFARQYQSASVAAGKPRQQIVPYFIASHPGSDLPAMIDLALYLKRNGYRPDQVQDFIPAPFDIATCMYYTGIDPFTKKPVAIAKGLNDRKMQRALMQFFKPENYFEVRDALIKAGRADLIGGCDGLIEAQPPKEALEARKKQANAAVRGDHYHTVANPAKGEKPGERGAGPAKATGYRPGRKTQRRQDGKKKGKGGSGPP
ncbi:YgiQ family radical SAM protein [Fimbriiglobus ruber]|uniref:Fe-S OXIDOREDUCTASE n=1 Tax=Fimbriiglobus ruber TaxID=1908690 RepID=A0A225E5C2_9BACT|nr:YgiQ family radical SAM protein [Fimbriiglobus ruber]OWK46964.1 Fe-S OXIDOREDUCTASE [Fimbriiglobus ruber]